jgi:hypothetical protein
MTPITSVRLATCVVAVTLVGAAAATLPAEARAEDGPVSVPEPQAVVPPVDAGAVLAGEASAAVESAIADALGGDGQEAAAPGPVEATATPTLPAEAPVDGTSAADHASTPDPEPSAPPEAAPTAPDTTPIPADTVAGIATSPAPSTPAATASSAQSAPTNVNVSVRIGSPGDNGAVTQVNVAASGVSVAPAAGTGNAASGAPATGSTSPAGGAAAPLPTAAAHPAGQGDQTDDEGTWSWQWNCLSMPDLSAISPTGSTAGSLPRNWTWIWNCGGNPSQYQDATSSQYQPSNVNVAIRISSPGNDGPVSQANVAVAVGAVAAAARPPQAPAVVLPGVVLPAVGPLAGVGSALSEVVAATTQLPVVVAPQDAVWLGGDASSALSAVPSIVELVDLPRVLRPPFGVGSAAGGERQLPVPGAAAAGSFGRLAPALSVEPGALPVGGGLSAVASAEGRASPAGTSSSLVADKPDPAPRWRAPLPQPLPQTVPSGASIAPATGGGSSGGGIPIFLALPFLAAMLDLARRVSLDRVALPSGHRSRVPEDPG